MRAVDLPRSHDGSMLLTVASTSRFVMTDGVAPGIGKTTLVRGLSARAAAAAIDLDLFEVDQIFTRPEFARIGRAFRDRTYPTAEMMLEGYRRLLSRPGQRCMVVFDWSCLGVISDLPWAEGRSDVLLDHARDVFWLTRHLRPALLNLVGDVGVAVARAAAQRGERWVRRYARLAARETTPFRSRLAAITCWIEHQPHRTLELDAFRLAGWPVWEIDAMRSADQVLEDAAGRLGIP